MKLYFGKLVVLLSWTLNHGAHAAPPCPSLDEVKQATFKNFRQYIDGPDIFGYDATVHLQNHWILRLQYYSVVPSTRTVANDLRLAAKPPVGPIHGGEGMKWFCTYDVSQSPYRTSGTVTMASLTTEMW
jgi:hypothetical protein